MRGIRLLLLLISLCMAMPASAHPGHGTGGFAAGLLHPLLGVDHLLAMLVVGLWAAQLGGRARWAVPASFVFVMALGAACALRGFSPPLVEAGIAASLLVLGLLVAMAGRLPLPAAMALSAVFAFCHGAAHGLELPAQAAPLVYAAGFLLATAALHGTGLAFGLRMRRGGDWATRSAGVLTAASGLVLSFS